MPPVLRRREFMLAIYIGIVLVSGAAAAVGDDADDGATDAAGGVTTTTNTLPAPLPSTTLPGTPPPTGPPAADALNGFVPAPLEWSGCGGDFQCAALAVPLDWANPAGPTITLSVSRLPAQGGEPLGALATNPGGPGASGNGYIRSGPFESELTDRFDIVSWDPRGVGDSSPLGCDGETVDAFVRLDSDPDDADEQAALDAGAQAVADECGAVAGGLLPYVGTGSVARDLEAIRRAYGGPMAYYGFSYGTAIGLHHLQLFPGAMTGVVLDGVVDPTLPLTDLLRGQATGFEQVRQDMFAACEDSDYCPDGGAEAAFDQLADELESNPLPVGEELVGPAELATATFFAGYNQDYWEPLYAALAAGLDGDGSILLQLAEGYRSFGAFDLYQAVSCLDSVNPRGGAAWAGFAAELEAISPRIGASIANEMLPCAFWPVESAPITGPVAAPGSGPVLVIGSTGDAATPLAQAETVAATLADGHLLVREGEGHTAYSVSECVQERAAAYLIDGTLPADGERCSS